eukprot:403345126
MSSEPIIDHFSHQDNQDSNFQLHSDNTSPRHQNNQTSSQQNQTQTTSNVGQHQQRFDGGSSDDRKEEKLVFKLIQRMEIEQLKQHLLECEHILDITEIYDRQGYSPLHFAAYKNNEKMAEVLCEFVFGRFHPENTFNKQELELKEKTLKEWVNTQSKGEEGFTPLHFAAFYGNIPLIRLLISYGADILAQNKQGINMMHVSAQGDQPASLNFFKKLGLDVNSRDKKQGTPLHWAAFSGSELALSYILAWDSDVNAKDSKGLTPLHLAVKQAEDLQSTRSIRHLLIKGADKRATNNDGRTPLDIAIDLRTPAMKNEILKILTEESKFMNDIFMIKPPLRKTSKSPRTMIIYLVLILISFLCVNCFIYPRFDNENLKLSIYICLIMTLLTMSVSWLLNPGYLKSDKDLDFMELLEQFEPNCLCPECEVIRTPRSRHCNICKKCVDRFDHHCPWINNCVGVRNHKFFYLFILFQLAYILQVFWISIYYMNNEFADHKLINQQASNSTEYNITGSQNSYLPYWCPINVEEMESPQREYLTLGVQIIVTVLSFAFILPLSLLVMIQTFNMMRGETTIERLGRRPRRMRSPSLNTPRKKLTIEYSMLQEEGFRDDRNCLGNCFDMLCNSKIKSQKEILQETKALQFRSGFQV